MSSLNQMSLLAMIALRDALLETRARLEREARQKQDAERLADVFGVEIEQVADIGLDLENNDIQARAAANGRGMRVSVSSH